MIAVDEHHFRGGQFAKLKVPGPLPEQPEPELRTAERKLARIGGHFRALTGLAGHVAARDVDADVALDCCNVIQDERGGAAVVAAHFDHRLDILPDGPVDQGDQRLGLTLVEEAALVLRRNAAPVDWRVEPFPRDGLHA